mgnify:CR=1 FL=1
MVKIDWAHLEQVACNLCQNTETQLLATNSRFNIPLNTVICTHCGLIYHNPRMTFDGFANFYEQDYRCLIEHDTRPVAELFQAQIKHGERILTWLDTYLSRGMRVLDIGSGPGGQLWAFRERCGAQVMGVEPAVEHAQWARETHALDIRSGMLEDFSFDTNSFDLVIISQTLNHLLDPFGSLQHVHSQLAPNGKIFLEVIDFVYWTRLSTLTMATTIDHPYMFAQETLRAMIEQAGFEIVKWEADEDMPNRTREPGQPNLHIRVLGVKSEPRTVKYPSYRDILKRIENNQRIYQRKHRWYWVYARIDRAKGMLRRIMGERGWNTMKNLAGERHMP